MAERQVVSVQVISRVIISLVEALLRVPVLTGTGAVLESD